MTEERNESSERRRFIRKLVALGGAGAALGLLQGNVNIPEAEAANGDSVKIGTTNTGTADTKLQTSSANAFIGESSSTSGRGLFGSASASSGGTYGVYGQSVSTGGTGVIGSANASSGTTYGVQGVATSPSGTGVYGYASHSTGTNYALYGKSSSTNGKAVYGLASAGSGTTYGVYGQSNSTGGVGVYGVTGAGSGANYGVMGVSPSTSGTGVYGSAPAGSGTNYGVQGLSASSSGAGVYANNMVTNGTALKCHGHALPDADNAYNCGDSGKRWKLVRAKTVTSGDLVFENGYKVTEDESDGLTFLNSKGTKIASLDSKGNFHIRGKIIQDL
jgi:hypothetical protein